VRPPPRSRNDSAASLTACACAPDPPPEMKAEALFSLSFIARLNQRIDLAIQHLQTVLDMGSTLWPSTSFPLTSQDVWFEMGSVFRDGEDEKAGDEKDAFLKSERDPADPESWHTHGKLLMQIQQYRQAQKAFLHAVEISAVPAPALWFSLANLHSKTFNYKEGCVAFSHFANLAHTQMDDQDEKITTLRESIQETGTSNLALNEELAKVKDRQATVMEEANQLSQEKEKFDKQMKAVEVKLGKGDGALNESKQKLDVCMKQLRIVNVEVERANGAKRRATEELEKSKTAYHAMRKTLAEEKEKHEATAKKTSEALAKIKDLEHELELARPGGEMDPVKLTADLKEMTEKFETTETKCADAVENLRVTREENSAMKIQAQDAETREKHKDMLLGKASSKIEKLTGTVRNLQTKSYEQLMVEKAELEKKAENAIESSRRSREDIKRLSESVYQIQTQSEMAQDTLVQEVAKLKELRAEQTRELKNLKQQNATLIDQLSTYRAAAEELRDAHGEVSQRHDEIELERTLLDNKLRKATDKLAKLEANEAASEDRALLVVAVDGLLGRLERVLGAAEREEAMAINALKQAEESGGDSADAKTADWKLHTMTDSDRALFKLMMMDDVDGLANMIKKVGTEEINALNSRGKSLLAVAMEKERKNCIKWLQAQGAKVIDIEYDRNNPGKVDGGTQYEAPPAPEATLCDKLLEEIWDPHRIIAVLQDMEGRFEKAVAKAEHLMSQSKDTEEELRGQLEDARLEVPPLQAALEETKTSAKDTKKQLLESSRLRERGLSSEIEKRRFSEWQLRAQLQDMQKRCNQALGLQRVEMVEHAKHKMTEMVLDQLMEDTSRNPTLAGELSTRKRNSVQRARSAESMNSTLQNAVPVLRRAASSGAAASEMMPVEDTGPSRPSTRPSTQGETSTYQNVQGSSGMDSSEANVDDIIAEIHRMKQLQDSTAYQEQYSRPISTSEIGTCHANAPVAIPCRNLTLMAAPQISHSIATTGPTRRARWAATAPSSARSPGRHCHPSRLELKPVVPAS